MHTSFVFLHTDCKNTPSSILSYPISNRMTCWCKCFPQQKSDRIILLLLPFTFRTRAMMDLHSLLSLVPLSNVCAFDNRTPILHSVYTCWSGRWGALHPSDAFSFDISCKHQILQALYSYYMSKRFQPSLYNS